MKKIWVICIALGISWVIYGVLGESDNKIYADLDKCTGKWIDSYNSSPEKLVELYEDNALLFADKQDVMQGKTVIKSYYEENKQQLPKIETANVLKRITVRKNIIYELGEMTTDKAQKLQYLVVWKRQDGTWMRELEAIAPKTVQDNKSAAELAASLQTWINLSKDVPELVNKLYTDNAVYCVPPIMVNKGKADIISAYNRQMQAGNTLPLTTVALVQTSDDLAYEIGQYSGGTSGYYILIWQKDSSGWKVRLDSNV